MYRIVKLGKYWWLVCEKHGHVGPYNNRKEAIEDKRGLETFERFQEVPGFITTEEKPAYVSG